MNEVDWWELETQHNDTVTRDELKTHLAAAIARAEAAEKRVAELEAARPASNSIDANCPDEKAPTPIAEK